MLYLRHTSCHAPLASVLDISQFCDHTQICQFVLQEIQSESLDSQCSKGYVHLEDSGGQPWQPLGRNCASPLPTSRTPKQPGVRGTCTVICCVTSPPLNSESQNLPCIAIHSDRDSAQFCTLEFYYSLHKRKNEKKQVLGT